MFTPAVIPGGAAETMTKTAPAAKGNGYSDRDLVPSGKHEKERLANALTPGQEKSFYRRALESQRSMITAVNNDKPDYAER